MEKLYKKDSVGKILQWSAEQKQDLHGVSIIMYSGELGGTISTTVRANIKGKNLNKSNETSPARQAELEIIALYKKKKQKGYKSLSDLKFVDTTEVFGSGQSIEKFLKENLSITTTDDNDNIKPMYCQQYYRKKVDSKKKTWTDPTGKEWDDRKYYYLNNPYATKEKGAIIINFPALIQPKINGGRALVSYLADEDRVRILSKEGKEYDLPHISDAFMKVKEIFNIEVNGEEIDVVFDGELYIRGELLQTISSAIKSTNLNTPRVMFFAFDLAIPVLSNLERIKKMKELLNFTTFSFDNPISYITTYKVANDKQVQQYTDSFITQGHEGSVVRDPDALYQFGKRPMTMVKLKRLLDEEFEIIDIKGQDKDPSLGLFVCKTKEGKVFDVTPKGDTEFKQLVVFQKHLFIGKMLTCSFYEYTEDGKPFHISDNCVRDYE